MKSLFRRSPDDRLTASMLHKGVGNVTDLVNNEFFEKIPDAPVTFTRPLSAFITNYFAERAAQDSQVYNTQVAAEITLQDGVTTLSYATTGLIIDSLSQGENSTSISPIAFAAKITGAPEVRHSVAKPGDASELTIVNLDYAISQVIPTDHRPFDNASIIVYLCFPKPAGNYEGLIYFVGNIVDVSGDDENAHFTNQSDVGIKLATIGKEITQRCVNDLGDAWCS